jgi:gamma-glutamyltranspeptidase
LRRTGDTVNPALSILHNHSSSVGCGGFVVHETDRRCQNWK